MKDIQHYVWRYYLRPWTTKPSDDNGTINCINYGQIKRDIGTTVIASEHYFYQLQDLSSDDISFITEFCFPEGVLEVSKTFNKGWIDYFTSVIRIEKLKDKIGITSSDLDYELLKCKKEFEENLHCIIETSSIPYLDMLYLKDTSFYKQTKDNILFNHFIATQYFRTKQMKTLILSNQMNGIKETVSLERCWNVISHIFATNIGSSLYLERDEFSMKILEICSDEDFITTDQPVINTAADYKKKVVLNDADFELFYPYTPKLAVLITKNTSLYKDQINIIDDETVYDYNKKMINASGNIIFSNRVDYLEKIKKTSF